MSPKFHTPTDNIIRMRKSRFVPTSFFFTAVALPIGLLLIMLYFYLVVAANSLFVSEQSEAIYGS